MKTRDIKAQLIAEIKSLRTLSDSEREYKISSIIDDLLSSRVKVTCKVSAPIGSPVPAYNAKADGDYSSWLAANNID